MLAVRLSGPFGDIERRLKRRCSSPAARRDVRRTRSGHANTQMPILDVEIVVQPGEVLPDGMSASLANAAASVFGTPPGHTWIRLRELPRDHYSEDGGGPPPGVLPVFVSVLKSQIPPEPALRDEVAALARGIAKVTNRPAEHVHIIYEPPASGRIAFGRTLPDSGGQPSGDA